MNRDETLRLWQRCQRAKQEILDTTANDTEAQEAAKSIWNGWAQPLIERRKALEEANTWRCETVNPRQPKGLNSETREWLEQSFVDFNSVRFRRARLDLLKSGDATADHFVRDVDAEGAAIDFRGFHFPGLADFGLSTFSGWVWFEASRFHGTAIFRSSRFHGWAGFNGNIRFGQESFFDEATFEDNAVFSDVIFSSIVSFRLCEFRALADFRRARFEGEADFFAIFNPRGFLVEGATFGHVPSFIQAKFSEAPAIKPSAIRRTISGPPVTGVSDSILESRYSALKRLSEQAKDHVAELQFFAQEVDARPWSRATFLHKLAATAYGALSRHGRSIGRPLGIWVFNGAFFTLVYHAFRVENFVNQSGECKWSIDSLVRPAIYLGIVNNIPFPGSLGGRVREAAERCVGGELAAPDLSVISTLQVLIASVLLFLVILGIRNDLRIK